MVASSLPINQNATALLMAETIFGDDVTITGASYNGDFRSSGVYSNGDTVTPGVTPSDQGVILSTGFVSDFTNSSGQENQSNSTSSNTTGGNNIADFNAAAGARTYDAAYLDVDFVPTGDLLTMQFVFASEEYPEFQSSVYQDFVGVWINGTLVEIDVGNGDTDPGNINSGENSNLYIDNSNDAFNTEMDGFTVTMTLTVPVNAGSVNSIRIGIADVADSTYDSALLIAADSAQTTLAALTDETSVYPNGSKTLDVLANDTYSGTGTLSITHINGVSVTAGSTVTLPSGSMVTLNADGTLTVTGDGDTEDYNFTYKVTDGTITDTGIVNVDQVPCFVAGTLIATPQGDVPVETLSPGDLVLTKDHGAQPLRWIGTRQVAAEGPFAPILIRAKTFGAHRDVLLSPLHRVLIRDEMAELLFGEDEVLVAARDLVNDATVLRQPGGEVTYVHLLFDQHQVVFSEGLATESFLPGPQTSASFDQETLQEICALFPELDPATGQGYGPAARRSLRRYEAELLMHESAVA
ncbi:Hint domain-containing protein [Aliishimia ponticola]|uniref:Hint domain-containing protein n=1 Tax=Aliishimia ponticola TaxID=2499833 RepID=A0A4S4NBE0_9RHOB|nr:Hint domain-containing protein [Aliishimia ponticola]THH35338.1 Hint domain-containing protein [Aliishimia ponticola]